MSVEESAKSLNKAMRGLGTDEKRIIKEISHHSKAQRQEIKRAYLTMFGKTLEEDLKSEISGHFLKGVLALLMPNDEYEVNCLREALKGIGTNERTLIQIICTKTPDELKLLSATYKKVFDRDLEQDLDSDLSGDFSRVMRSLASGNRDSSSAVDLNLARKEAQELYDAGEGKLGTDEIEFVRVLCSRSYNQLRATFDAYFQIADDHIEKSIMKEMSGILKLAFLAIIKSIKNLQGFFAEQLYEAMKGVGTKDNDLIRLLVCRAEIDLPQIKFEYERLYGKKLYDAVKSELSGDYEKLFLALIGKD